MKRKFSVIFILFAFILAMSFTFNTTYKKSFADSYDILNIDSKSSYLMDANTKTVIHKHNETMRLPIASMCKIMTLLLSFEEIDNGTLSLEDEITISENASGMGGSQVFLESNANYKVKDLIKSIVVASANDASVAMAERISGNEDQFVIKMNEKARNLGMNNTYFVNCTGLPKPKQYSSAEDVAKMFSELITHKDYFTFSKIWMDNIPHPNNRFTGISNTNKLIRFYSGCDSGKTGYTSEAGHCLCSSALRNNMRLISVIISAPDSKTRFKNATEMFNYGFNNYENKLIIDSNSPLDIDVNVEKGQKSKLQVISENPVYIFNKKGEKRSFEFNFTPTDKIKAPITKGEIVGKLSVFEKGREINSVNVLSNENINKKTYFNYLNDIGHNWNI